MQGVGSWNFEEIGELKDCDARRVLLNSFSSITKLPHF